ncbi:MAG: creatininase family protein [Candidatus Heimdallarchaeota archaeon]|nr:creatininase family protein [Candidatus Heimdallarchaeota archaeon]
MKPNTSLLHEMSWTDIEKLDKETTVFLLPVGSTEQHGPQNPLGTDFLIAEHVARKSAFLSMQAYCLPTLPIGVASHHRNFAGTLWTSRETLEKLIKDVINSINYHGFKKIIVINGHGGNTSSIMNAISDYNDTKETLCTLFEWWRDEEIINSVFGTPSAIHADAIETSAVWAVRPDLAKEERLTGLTSAEEWGRKIGNLYFPSRTDQFTATGIAGRLEGISIEKGDQALEKVIEKLVKAIEHLSIYQ